MSVLVPVWRSGSIRTWIGLGILIALLPLLLSAVTGHLILNRDVIPFLQGAHSRQHDQIDPTQRLRLLIWSSISPVERLVENGNAADVQTYKTVQSKIAETFAALKPQMQDDLELLALFDQARKDWIAADSHVSEAIAGRRTAGDWQLLARFHHRIVAADQSLSAAYTKLASAAPESQATVELFNRFEMLVLAFASVSVGAFFALFIVISQILSGSTKRLVEGAQRFASGDKDQKIEVRVPPDFRGVLEELNRSIIRTQDAEHALANRANRDGLTELLNRRAFDDALSGLFARRHRFDEQFALLLIDLDHFKSINDTYGHGAGDEVLRVTAARMMTDLRPFDQVFRVGGEEFAVLLSGVDSSEARQIGNRVLHVIGSHPIPLPSQALCVTASIGVVTDAAGSDPSTLYDAADAALYHAKTTGRNRVVVGERAYSSSPKESATR